MKIVLNGKDMELDKVMSIESLLAIRGLEPDRVVVECNFDIVKREDLDKVILKEGDKLEVLRFVGGG